MSANLSPVKNGNQPATHADYAATDFEPYLTKEQAEDFGGPALTNSNITMRTAAIALTKSKAQLIKGFGVDDESRDCLMQTIEALNDIEDFLKLQSELVEKAIARLLSVACSIADQCEEGESANALIS